ncbi:GGDEF domain-containing protein [Aquabacterium sp.]|uniref:GGDEF domain-containing protein n=1 Tax=Aquabacterium sp. TaxID=1872578 RepID=UPI002C028B36|nr:GGDEF domain-containing protein [Aquabacterium sp.]HSW05990.1 GGDEF domain-containing protein [Aquabacterium sp.]
MQTTPATKQSPSLLIAMALTLAALLFHPYLPERRLALTPTQGANFFLMPSAPEPGHSKFNWIDKNRFHFECVFGTEERRFNCNFVYMLAKAGSDTGVDLSRFEQLHLTLNYSGTARYLRVAIRNFDPRFSKAADGNSAKFNYIHLSPRDLERPLQVALSEFVVPEWWTTAYDLPRQYIHPDLSNATAFSIDLLGEAPGSRHELKIDKIEFAGPWVSAERWYLGIICAWLAAGGLYGIARLVHLQRVARQQRLKIRDLTANNVELRSETDRFRKLSTVDALTNTFNRHGIELIIDSLDMHIGRVSLVLVDLDQFKAVNDQRGHDAGDRVLQKAAEVLTGNSRASGKVGRWGGEEFILICPDTAPRSAAELADRLRRLIETTVFEPDAPLAVTASFGVAAMRPGERFAAAFKRADTALYRAKSLGRNCVVVAEPRESAGAPAPGGTAEPTPIHWIDPEA